MVQDIFEQSSPIDRNNINIGPIEYRTDKSFKCVEAFEQFSGRTSMINQSYLLQRSY